MPVRTLLLAALILAGTQLGSLPSSGPDAGRDPSPASPTASPLPVRGMTISCRMDGVEWASDEMVRTMENLKALGVNWVAIHPYAGIRKNGNVYTWRRLGLETPPAWLTRPIAEARRLGLKIMIKPHIGYWGSGFRWRGEIRFQTEEEWRRFFDDYRIWVSRVAEICREADAFVVGTELEQTIRFDGEWRKIIASVRRHFPGPITYAANWTEYEKIAFWDELDAIGIQAYFPLMEAPPESRPVLPPPQTLLDGWRQIMSKVRAFGEGRGKPVVFTELGYNRSASAPFRPWDDSLGGPHAEEIQRRCLAAALQALQEEPSVVGAFLWKWFPGDGPARTFSLTSTNVRRLIAEAWNPAHAEESLGF